MPKFNFGSLVAKEPKKVPDYQDEKILPEVIISDDIAIATTPGDKIPRSDPETWEVKKVPKSNIVSKKRVEDSGFSTGEIDKNQEIADWVFGNLLHLYDGIYNYLRIWKTRYHKYLIKSPESPVIFKYQKMQEILDYIKELTSLKEEKLK